MASGIARAPGRADSDAEAITDAVLTASRLLVAISARSISTADVAITLPQFRLLVVLSSRGPSKLTSLAEHLGVNPSTATRMVDRLLNSGLVSRGVNPHSRREVVIALTEPGAVVVRQVTEQRRADIAEVVSRMPAERRRDLVTALEAFSAAGGEPKVSSVEEPARSGDWS